MTVVVDTGVASTVQHFRGTVGETLKHTLTVTNSNGVPRDLTGGTVFWALREGRGSGDFYLSRSSATVTEIAIATQAGDTLGQCTVFATPGETALIPEGVYWYGAWLSQGGEIFDIASGQVTLKDPVWDHTETVTPVVDGSDQLAAIQAAIDAANARGGGVVTLTAGTYRISSHIELKAGVILRGLSKGLTTIKPLDDSADACNPCILVKGVDNAGVMDLTIDGNATGLTQAVAHAGIRVSGSSYCRFENLHFQDLGFTVGTPGGAHILINAFEAADPAAGAKDQAGVASYGNRIRWCTFDDAGVICQYAIQLATNWLYDIAETAFTIPTSRTLIEHCHTDGFSFNAISLEGPLTEYNDVKYNTMENHAGNTPLDNDKGASRNRYIGNKIRNCALDVGGLATAAMRCQGYYNAGMTNTLRYARDNVFEGNVVENLGAALAGSACLTIAVAVDGGIFRDNILDATHDTSAGTGIEIRERVSNVSIVGNRITNSQFGIVNDTDNIAAAVSGFKIEGNDIEASSLGVRLHNSTAFAWTKTVVEHNTIRGACATGIRIGDDIDDTLVARNFLYNTGATAIQLDDSANVNVVDNYARGQSTRGIWVTVLNPTAWIDGNSVQGQTTPLKLDGVDADTRSARIGTNLFGNGYGPAEHRAGAAPLTGTWAVGDFVRNTAPSAGGPFGWCCTTAGTPGTWKALTLDA